jgi:hypothetical protein
MTIRQQVRNILSDKKLTLAERIKSVRSLIPAEVRKFPFKKLNALTAAQVPKFKKGLAVVSAMHAFTEELIAEKQRAEKEKTECD